MQISLMKLILGNCMGKQKLKNTARDCKMSVCIQRTLKNCIESLQMGYSKTKWRIRYGTLIHPISAQYSMILNFPMTSTLHSFRF